MIDSPWTPASTSEVSGDGSTGGYTSVSWKDTANGSADDGLTITPNGGDTGKTLFFPNTGRRDIGGATQNYGTYSYYFSADQLQSYTSDAWRLLFSSNYSSGRMNLTNKLNAYSIRCVRS